MEIRNSRAQAPGVRVRLRFEVYDALKGRLKQEVDVEMLAIKDNAFDADFKIGQEYLIFANYQKVRARHPGKPRRTLDISDCARLADAKQWLKEGLR